MEKEIKVSKSYSLPPSQIEWLRKRATEESTPQKSISASAILEGIIANAMAEIDQSPTPIKPKEKKSALAEPLAA